MTTAQTIDALIDWAIETLPELQQARSAPEGDFPFPDLAVAITGIRQVAGRTQQRLERVRTCELILLVEPEPADEASASLGSFCDTLMDELARDRTLANRVKAAEAISDASLVPPFVDIQGGGSARQATLTITVRDEVAP